MGPAIIPESAPTAVPMEAPRVDCQTCQPIFVYHGSQEHSHHDLADTEEGELAHDGSAYQPS